MKKISKRQFFQSGLADFGAMLSGLNPVGGLAKSMIEMGKTNIPTSRVSLKFTKESPYSEITPKGVQCLICPNNCILREGISGICKTHVAENGKLYTIAYGNPCSAHVDPIEKKPLFHFLPASQSYSIATAGCNLSCLNCQNWEISQRSPKETRNVEMFPEKVIEEALKNGCKSIAYTYSEPTAFYEYMFDTARYARSYGIKNLLISNGFINEKPLRDLSKYLDGANIDLKAFTEETYVKLTGGRLKPVLDSLKILKEEGVWLEITSLVLPGFTDDMDIIRKMCEWLVANKFADNPLHFSRFHPLYHLTNLPCTPLESLEKARNIALETGIRYVYIGNVSDTHAENTHCPSCKKIVIERRGFAVLAKHLNKDLCEFCNTKIAGAFL